MGHSDNLNILNSISFDLESETRKATIIQGLQLAQGVSYHLKPLKEFYYIYRNVHQQ
jgi:hypothetical protein